MPSGDDDTPYEETKKEKISSILQIHENDLVKAICVKINLKFLKFFSNE
jgi:hypothetical protein